ncbi:hypothetical protein [Streptomyces sp. NPDC059272]
MATDLMMISLGAAVACNNSTERIRNPLAEPQGRRARHTVSRLSPR